MKEADTNRIAVLTDKDLGGRREESMGGGESVGKQSRRFGGGGRAERITPPL